MKNVTAKCLLVLLLLAIPGAAAGQEAVWNESCRFVVEVDGRPSGEASVFEQRGVPQLLGHLGDGTWFLVDPAPQQVKPLAADAVELRQGGREAVLIGAVPPEGKRLTLTPSGLTFDVAGRWLRVILTPDLLGEVKPDDFLSMCPDFAQRERDYTPDPGTVQAIASCGEEITLEIYFGSWCPHCQQVLPELFKSLRLADNPRLQIRMIGLPRGFGNEPVVRAKKVKGVPTVIVMDEGVELGRFSGAEGTPIEKSLADLLPG